jgi:hypothetical protein
LLIFSCAKNISARRADCDDVIGVDYGAQCATQSVDGGIFSSSGAAKSPAALISLRLHNFASNGRNADFSPTPPPVYHFFQSIPPAAQPRAPLMVFFPVELSAKSACCLRMQQQRQQLQWKNCSAHNGFCADQCVF